MEYIKFCRKCGVQFKTTDKRSRRLCQPCRKKVYTPTAYETKRSGKFTLPTFRAAELAHSYCHYGYELRTLRMTPQEEEEERAFRANVYARQIEETGEINYGVFPPREITRTATIALEEEDDE